MASGCATRWSNTSSGLINAAESTFAKEKVAQKEVDEARRMVEAGDTSTVIPRLLHTIAKYPDTDTAVEARYWLAMAYYKEDVYRDAIDLFSEYLAQAPNGLYAGQAQGYVTKLSTEYEAKYPAPGQLDEMIASLAQLVKAYPNDVKNRVDLAALLWTRGNYAEAGALYNDVVKRAPSYVNDETIKRRMEWLPNGGYIVLTPAEVQRRQVEAQPLVVVNTASFQSGRDLITREARYYSVTGQVVNRGDSVLYGVEVVVTVYGVGSVVFDTTSVGIRRLNPGEIRAFSVRFGNFENIENVNRFECTATFER
ncbi:MAG: tetratricopeptide repeat protein [Nitrospiraceae bacterium]|nr:tetratricopeptide repeat protein [Nitrospiraceae bacterium]